MIAPGICGGTKDTANMLSTEQVDSRILEGYFFVEAILKREEMLGGGLGSGRSSGKS